MVAVFETSTLSRLPVYNETLDQPLGLVHLKDFALTYGFGAPAAEFDLRGLLRPLLYAPPSMPIGVLLQKMQAAHIHMALVIDEYGGVDGLVTIEDLLEQIVGDIADEHDEAEGAALDRGGARRLPRRGAHGPRGLRGGDRRAARRPALSPRRSTRSAAWSSASPAGCRCAARWCCTPRARVRGARRRRPQDPAPAGAPRGRRRRAAEAAE